MPDDRNEGVGPETPAQPTPAPEALGLVCSPHALMAHEKALLLENGKDPSRYAAVNFQPQPGGIAFIDQGTHYVMAIQVAIPKRFFPELSKQRVVLAGSEQQASASFSNKWGAIPCIRMVVDATAIDYELRRSILKVRDGEGKTPFEAGLVDADGKEIPFEVKPEPANDPVAPAPRPVLQPLPKDITDAAEKAHAIPRPFFDALLGGLVADMRSADEALPFVPPVPKKDDPEC